MEMTVKEVNGLLVKNFNKMTEGVTHLFEVKLGEDEEQIALGREQLWAHYLDSFPAGTNEIFRERRDKDCSACRSFIRNFGHVVVIKNNVIHTIWDVQIGDSVYQPVFDAMAAFVRSKVVGDVFVTKLPKIGTKCNHESLENGTVLTWDHFHIELPSKFVERSSKSVGEIKNDFRAPRNVFKRSLEELTEESVQTVLELTAQNSLYKGEEWKGALTEFLKHKKAYDKLTSESEKENYTWEQSIKVGGSITKIRNHSIGQLLINISENMDLDEAVRKYEKIVAPENYKRPQAIFTKKMLEEAKQLIQKLGYMESLNRRYAKLDDITVNNILFSNRDAAKRISGSVFDEMEADIAVSPKKFTAVEEISIDKFVKDVLPTVKELKLLLENKHAGNMTSIIAPEDKDAKSMFKWNNGFSWAYAGNMTDSSMKERVKAEGGKVDGVLRFSIQWNDEDYNPNDFDAHCIEPGGNQIYFSSPRNIRTTGELDVDIRRPVRGKPAVENITWSDRSKMKVGTYKFFVKNFSHNGGVSGFKSEIEADGQINSFEYAKELRHGEKVEVAEVYFDGVSFTIKEKMPSSVSSREIWNLKTNQFVPVSVVMYSPNYWDEQEGLGHRHYMFMLKDCVNSENPNGFYNEFLKEDLMKHKRVFEALGSKMRVQDVEDQLSGVGFSSTKRNEVVLQIKGSTERIVKVKF